MNDQLWNILERLLNDNSVDKKVFCLRRFLGTPELCEKIFIYNIKLVKKWIAIIFCFVFTGVLSGTFFFFFL
jgi:hypothetical protein